VAGDFGDPDRQSVTSDGHVGFANPEADGAIRYMSMRVRARDVHGNRVEETSLHVYRLR